MTVTGLSEMLAALRQVEQDVGRGGELEDRLDDVLHDAVIAGLRSKEEKIPKDTGALKLSLLRKSDRAHVWESNGRGDFKLGSTLPQAQYQAKNIPTPDEDVIVKAVEAELVRVLEERFR